MNTRSNKKTAMSESGYGESDHPQRTPASRHRIFEDLPRSPSRTIDRLPTRMAGELPPAAQPRPATVTCSVLTEEHRAACARNESAGARQTSPSRSEKTIRSRRTQGSAAARAKMAEYEAARELAEIEARQLELRRSLVEKRLEAELAVIASEHGSVTNAGEEEHRRANEDRVSEWVDRSVEHMEDHCGPVSIRGEDHAPMHEKGESEKAVKNKDADSSGIERLAEVLQKMMNTNARPPPRQTAELPIFTGSMSEWLPFRAAMEDSTRMYGFSATENLLRLRNCLKGEARETVLSQLYTSSHPDKIMKTLEMKYGRPEDIMDKAIEDLKKLPRAGTSAGELNDVAIRLQNIVHTMKNIDRRGYLHNPMLVRDVLGKISPHLISKWAEYAIANEERIQQDSEIMVLSEFLMEEADRIMRYTHMSKPAPRESAPAMKKEKLTRKPFNKEKVYTVDTALEERSHYCFKCKSDKHYTTSCPQLKQMNIDDRWQWAKENRMCFRCLKKKHLRNSCTAKPCGVKGCAFSHHSLLHKEKTKIEKPKMETAASEDTNSEDGSAAVMNVISKSPGSVLLKTCKVKISGPRGELTTYALLDEGSTVTLIDEELAAKITDAKPSQRLNIKGINEHRQVDSSDVKIKIKGIKEKETFTIKAKTMKGLTLHQQNVPESVDRYPHLKSIRSRIHHGEVKPRLLIGADNWHLIVSRRLRTGKRNEPAASLTKLGWVLHGTVPRATIVQNGETILHVYTQATDTKIEKLVESYFDIDSLGVAKKSRISEQDQRAMKIFEKTARRINGNFEVGQPWKKDDVVLPDNYEYALRRLLTIEKKMEKAPDFKEKYTAQVKNLLEKNYAVKCDGSEEDSQVKWFLPHFAVTNVNKPDRIRLVFDAAARAHGVSLNDYLLEGPDLLAPLTQILFGFRERRIAVTADIEEMFLRIKIRKEDQPAQMFLWRDDPRDPPQKMKMVSMIFGASSSPYLAHSVRNKNAEEYKEDYPDAVRAIQKKHYMDDYLDSFDCEEEARRVIKDVIFIHEQASFNLRGWNSNSEAVISSIPEEKRSKNAHVNISMKAEQSEKTLGLRWNPQTDTLGFNTDIKRVPEDVKKIRRSPTKREALSAIMSIYDPLGLISQYTIIGKIILQKLWQKKIGWDEELPDEEAEEFRQWIGQLNEVAAIKLPRCYSYTMSPHAKIELHVFSDASEQAYACAAYWRITHEDGKVQVILVMAKAKVTPLKIQTIPRLELQAALVGARIADTIRREHTWKPERTTHWTDSRTVLHWIWNDRKKYTPFVAHRLAEITELSAKEDWRWVPTLQNVADDATREKMYTMKSTDRWFTGPPFLLRPYEEWPTIEETCEENSNEVVLFTSTTDKYDMGVSLPDISRFSSYHRLIRSTATVKLFIDKMKMKNKELSMDMSRLEEAELMWIKQSQRESFGEDVKRLSAKQPLMKTSRIAKLDPVLEDGVIRARGRIRSGGIVTHDNNPIILDGRHPFTKLLVHRYHREAHHANNERVVNELRQRYFIIHLRPTVRRIGRDCQFCKVYKSSPITPSRGDLPRARLEPGHRAFTYCGIDFFGPMNVTIGRRHEKRWGALFTCLTTRAVHLELVASLSTDSAIMAIRRMAARRGWPKVMFSDNATNFRGADVELKKAYEAWGPALKDYGLTYGMDWRFIPPGAPHMGGCWERLVRSVKTALKVTLHERAPKEEVLSTLLTEAEYSVNARPLTHVSVDPADEEALTPNHFLIGSSSGLPLTGPCDEVTRSTWKKTQALADMFWQRWVLEYLPTLVPRGEVTRKGSQVQVGDLVVIVDGSLPRNVWPRGVVVRVYPGPDGIVRTVDVETRGGVFRRPCTRIAVLHVEEEASRDLRRGENVTNGDDNCASVK